MATIKRTDPHRPGAIIPADYQDFGCFAYGTGYEPSFNTEILSSPIVREHGFVEGSKKGCQVCGRNYRFGVLLRHLPTGQFITMGHECARKYEVLADFAAFDAKFEAHLRANARVIQAAKNKAEIEKFLTNNEGLREALACGHRITNDLAEKLQQYRSLSPAQMNLAFKLHSETYCPARPQEANVPAPVGRIDIRGTIVSVKEHASDFGASWKMTVKVATDAGVWLCWSTVPAMLLDQNRAAGRDAYGLKGREVTFTATLQPGREKHFAFAKRPTGGRIMGEEPAAVSPRPGMAGNVVAKLNAEIGIATVGY